MSVINATLIVQVVHFFIAFALIKYFFFKPAVAHINAEETLQESLVNGVQEYQRIVADKEKEISDQLHDVRAYFSQNVPSLKTPPTLVPSRPSVVMPHFNEEAALQASQEIAQAIIKKVAHGA
jgi:hypothetical protein